MHDTEYLFEFEDCPEEYEADQSEDDENDLVPVTDPEIWADHWSEELVILWHKLVDQCTSNGYAILDKCTFPQFVEFCWQGSSRYPPRV